MYPTQSCPCVQPTKWPIQPKPTHAVVKIWTQDPTEPTNPIELYLYAMAISVDEFSECKNIIVGFWRFGPTT